MATAGPPRPRSTARRSGWVRCRRWATTARTITSSPCARVIAPKVASPGSRPDDSHPGRSHPAYSSERASSISATSGRRRTKRPSSSLSSRCSLRPRRHTTHTTATAQAANATSRSRPRDQSGGGVRGAQPGDQPASVPEAGPAQGGRSAFLLGLQIAGERLLGLVVAPGAPGQVPQQNGQGGGDEGREGEPAAGTAPPAAVRDGGREEAQPGVAVRAGPCARALPGRQVEGDLAGRRDEQHREGEPGEPHQQAVQSHGAAAAAGGGAHPVGEVDDHERQQHQPQGAGASHRARVPLPEVRLHQT